MKRRSKKKSKKKKETTATVAQIRDSATYSEERLETIVRPTSFHESCSWFKNNGLFAQFIVSMIATILGVLVYFWLAGIFEQRALDRDTRRRLQLVLLEVQYNMTDAKDILDSYADQNSLRINVNRPNSTAAMTALQDANLMHFIPLHKVSMLRSYVNSISTFNLCLEVHRGFLQSQNFRRTPQLEEAREKVYENAASVVAIAEVLDEELKEYIDDSLFDKKEAARIEERVKYIEEKALKGKVTLSKEN